MHFRRTDAWNENRVMEVFDVDKYENASAGERQVIVYVLVGLTS